MATKILRVELADILGPVGPAGAVRGEVWARYSSEVRLTDGTVVVPAKRRLAPDAAGVVDFEVVPNDDATVHADYRGFGVVVGWDLTYRGESGKRVELHEPGRTVAVTSADPAVVSFGLKAPAVPVDPLVAYPTEATVDAKIVAERTVLDGRYPKKTDLPLNVMDYGAVGDGVADDTAAVVAAFAAAKALRVATIGGNVWRPGATVALPAGKTFKLSTLAAPIVVSCNVDGAGATLVTPNGYAQSVLLVGHETSGNVLHDAALSLPDVQGTVAGTAHAAGSVGVTVQNVVGAMCRFGRVTYFETAHHYTGLGIGTAYNTFHPGWVDLCKVAYRIVPKSGGWVNQNNWVGGSVTQSPVWSVPYRAPGWRHLVMGQGAGFPVHANTFTGCSFEGALSEYTFDVAEAYDNVWHGLTRFETGGVGVSAVVVGAPTTFINVSSQFDALAVGRTVYFDAPGGTMPAGLTANQVYYVTYFSAGSFTVSATKGGAAVSMTTNGSGMVAHFPPSLRFDNTAGVTQGNVLRDYYANAGLIETIRVGAAANPARAPIAG